MSTSFCLKKRALSFKYAIQGLSTLVRTQHNMWIHLLATALVVGAGFYFEVQTIEWLFLIFAISIVWMAEAFNTAIEFLCNRVSTEQDPMIGHAKDLAAAAVLIASIGAAIIGIMIFLPYIQAL